VEPQYWTLTPGHHVTSYNNNSHVTSLTNHSSPYDRLQVLGSDFGERSSSISQTLATNSVVDEFFTNVWNNHDTPPNLPPSRQPTDEFQPTKSLQSAGHLPVPFDDVISARQRAAYYGNCAGLYPPANHITWSDGPLQRCQYGKNSVSGSSFGTYQMTYNSGSSMTVYPTSSSPWLRGQQEPSYRTCAEYRMSRHHVVSDVTSAQCGWTGACDLDEMWEGKFLTPLEGL